MGLKLLSGFQAVRQLPPGRSLLLYSYKNTPKPWQTSEGVGADLRLIDGSCLGDSGSFWEPLGASGSLWEPLGASGSLWELLGASGSLWEPLGASVIVFHGFSLIFN